MLECTERRHEVVDLFAGEDVSVMGDMELPRQTSEQCFNFKTSMGLGLMDGDAPAHIALCFAAHLLHGAF